MSAKERAIERARLWIDKNAIVLDTETTGIDKTAEIVEIALLDCRGNVLLDELVRPTVPIPRDATRVHGITDDAVAGARTWAEIDTDFRRVIESRQVVIFNKSYDSRIVRQTAGMYRLTAPAEIERAQCAMIAYADYRHGYSGGRWIGLKRAALAENVTISGRSHRALTDCMTTLEVIRSIAA